MKVKLGVIADDLTGANDTGVQYAKQGLETVVLMDAKNLKEIGEKADVVVINTESRLDDDKTAYLKVKEAAKILKEMEINAVYKKIDSTLRGNIGAELDAIMDEWKINVAILVPAFPRNKRVTIGGYQLVNQVPLSMTEISRDPLTPVKESYVPALLKAQTKRNVVHIPLSKVMDEATLEKELKKAGGEGEVIIVLDAATQNDLKRIAKIITLTGFEKLTSGPAGLAEEMPKALGLISGKPAILICGSISEVTLKQIRRAEEMIKDLAIKLDINKILKNGKGRDEEIWRIIKEVKANVAEEKDSIITSAVSKESVEEDIRIGKKLGLSNAEISEKIASALGKIAYITAEEEIAGIILTGGAIATAALKTMGAIGVKVLNEIMPGIPIGRIIGPKFNGLKIITKAGAFGDQDALSNSIRQIKRDV